MMEPLYQTHDIRRIESAFIKHHQMTEYQLMHTAGVTALRALLSEWPMAIDLIVVCGKGNNAGDGFVLAREAYLQGLHVRVVTVVDHTAYQGAAKIAAEACLSVGLHCHPFDDNTEFEADVIVDAVLGTGLKGDVTGDFAKAILAINNSQSPVFSLDVPSGLNADTGAVHGCAVMADLTQTFIALKTGLFTANGSQYAGKINVSSLEITQDFFHAVTPAAFLLNEQSLRNDFPKRRKNSHKGDFGHVLIVGGDQGMTGAVQMAAEAALRVGAGLVSVASRAVVPRPEVMSHLIHTASDLAPLLKKATTVVIGPGLGQSAWSREIMQVMMNCELPMVVDADALNLLSELPQKKSNWILTPHPGEAAKLLKCTPKEVQSDRFAASKKIIAAYDGVVVLKGAGTLIQTQYDAPVMCAAGNPGMATGGMGDVLSGVIGGLLAQGFPLFSAAKTGVLLHALAGDDAARADGERGMIATDLMPYLRKRVNPFLS